MLLIALLYSLIFYFTITATSFVDFLLSYNPDRRWMLIVSQVLSYTLLATFTIMTFHMITMSVTYDLKFTQLLRNSFLFTIGLLPQNLFFIFLGAIPFLVMLLGSFFMGLGIILVLVFGFSLMLLVWTDFSQWSYDKFINDKVPGAQKNRGIYEKVKESNSGALKQYREQIALAGRSSLSNKPIKPITDDELTIRELPLSFNRNDIEKLNESKRVIYEDHEKYIEEHKNDPEFQKTEEEQKFDLEQEERRKRIEKAKKELSKRKNK
jgi:hypothetical protein